MRDVDSDIRESLERLTDPSGDTPRVEALWGELLARRRKRRARNGALATLPLIVAVLVVGVLWLGASDDGRSDVAAGGDRSDAPEDFPAFEMVYRTQSFQGGQLVPTTWTLHYESMSDWELVMVETGEGDSGSPFHRQTFSNGTLIEYASDGTVISEERLDDLVAPMALMSRGPRMGEAEAGDTGSAYRHEYTSSRELRCPDDPAEGGPYCEQPGKTIVIDTVEAYNQDGVPVFAEERISGTDRVVWQFEVLSYERIGATQQAGIGTLRVENIQVVGNGPLDGGTERAVIVFNEPLPVVEAQYVPDILSADPASGLAYTTQGPDSTRVCDSVHSVPQGAVGSVDLLVPARWFADGEEAHTGPGLETIDNPAKFPICGPHNGFIQYAMWSPLSADPAHVTVTVSPDRTSITIQISSEGEVGLDPLAGQGVVAEFLDRLRAGDLEAAAEKWTGYPEFGPDSTPAERIPHVEDLAADPTFARILESDTTTTFVVPSTDEGGQVVTVLDARQGENAPAAIAFLTGWSGEQGNAGTMWIQRLPLDSPTTDTVDLPAGSYVQRGQDIVVPGVPSEGGARAFIGDQEVPVEVDYDNLVMTITIPDDADGDVAVTIVTPSPELPGVHAFAVTVR